MKCRDKGKGKDKGKRKATEPVNYLDLAEDSTDDDMIYCELERFGSDNAGEGSSKSAQRPQKKSVNTRVPISARQEAVDRSFSTALVSAEQERVHQRQFLDKLEQLNETQASNLSAIANEMKDNTQQALEDQRLILERTLDLQHRFFSQMMFFMREEATPRGSLAPGSSLPPLRPQQQQQQQQLPRPQPQQQDERDDEQQQRRKKQKKN